MSLDYSGTDLISVTINPELLIAATNEARNFLQEGGILGVDADDQEVRVTYIAYAYLEGIKETCGEALRTDSELFLEEKYGVGHTKGVHSDDLSGEFQEVLTDGFEGILDEPVDMTQSIKAVLEEKVFVTETAEATETKVNECFARVVAGSEIKDALHVTSGILFETLVAFNSAMEAASYDISSAEVSISSPDTSAD